MHDGIVAVVFAVLFTPVVSLAIGLTTANQATITAYFGEVLALSTCVTFVHRVIKINWPQLAAEPGVSMPGQAPQVTRPEPPPAPQPRLLRRLDGVCTADILRLTVEDHYVEVVLLDRPSQRVLMRFADAVDEIEGLEGLFIHRSHWVVRAYVEGALIENGREMVQLVDGSRVPVSRTYRSNLAQAGVRALERDRVAG